ncbi:hypothetical protein CEP54_002364 [Fusarium duplospermum]|uniref:Uncharacterized protein n=1 Tax=Fusarium duplospermum TaxID=1325734 RepID=A0A428QVD1_9HYPO|nr:hypothetical protein CEP54_002364 [Fusarium duplospermum]
MIIIIIQLLHSAPRLPIQMDPMSHPNPNTQLQLTRMSIENSLDRPQPAAIVRLRIWACMFQARGQMRASFVMRLCARIVGSRMRQ